MLELVDNEDLKSFALGRTGSSPVASTKKEEFMLEYIFWGLLGIVGFVGLAIVAIGTYIMWDLKKLFTEEFDFDKLDID